MSGSIIASKRCQVQRANSGPSKADGFSKPFFVSMDDRLSNFWGVGTFDSGTAKVQASPINADQSDPIWQNVVLYPESSGGRALSLTASGLVVFGDAQLFNCWARFAWTNVGANGDFVLYVT